MPSQSAVIQWSKAILPLHHTVSLYGDIGNIWSLLLARTAADRTDASDLQRPAQCGGRGASGVCLRADIFPLYGICPGILRSDSIPRRNILFPIYPQHPRIPARTKACTERFSENLIHRNRK